MKNIKPQLYKKIEKLLHKTPKVRVIAIKSEDALKAKMLKRLIEHEWPEIENRLNKEIVRPMTRCFLFGSHKWRGYGVRDRHICKICGWKTSSINDPRYMGFGKVEWDKGNYKHYKFKGGRWKHQKEKT